MPRVIHPSHAAAKLVFAAAKQFLTDKSNEIS